MAEAPDLNRPIDLKQNGMVQYGLDDGMLVDFYEEPMFMEYLSKTAGSPIYRMQIMTRIRQPGNRLTIWTHPTKGITYEMVIDPDSGEYHTNWDILEVCENGDVPEPTKYPKAWAAFMRKGISADTGLPIEQWGTVSRSYAESLKAQHIHTVEALAGLTDQQCQGIMGAVKYRDLAKAHLDEKARTSILAREQERASRFEEMAAQQAKTIEDLKASVMALQAQVNGKAGFPQPPPSGVRPQTEHQVIAPELAQMSKAQAQKKHKIPPAERAA